jgi:creatinine amidohydrolase
VRKGGPRAAQDEAHVAPTAAPDPAAGESATPPSPLVLADLRSPQFAEALDTLELVLIPVGAHEQHGPALPVSTDTLSAQVLSGLAGALLGPRVGVAPPIPWGVSWHHLGLPGTISLREETLIAIVEDIVTSLHGYGIERFVLVNTHGGNNAALQIAAERCHLRHKVPMVASVYAYSLIAGAAGDTLGPESIGHGGGDESAIVLATRPDLVDTDALGTRELNEPVRRVMSIVRAAGGVLPIAQDRTSTSGASGDSTRATGEAGSAVLGRAAGQLQAIVEELLDLDIEAFRSHSPS